MIAVTISYTTLYESNGKLMKMSKGTKWFAGIWQQKNDESHHITFCVEKVPLPPGGGFSHVKAKG